MGSLKEIDHVLEDTGSCKGEILLEDLQLLVGLKFRSQPEWDASCS
jgi:hypothetical protein